MKPRRLHKLTIFSIRCESVALMRNSLLSHRFSRIYTDEQHADEMSAFIICVDLCNPLNPRYPRSSLRLYRDFSFDRARDETVLVRGVMHLIELFRRRLLVA